MIGLSVRFCSDSDKLVLLDRKWNVKDIGRKWKRSDSSDSDSVALMTPLTTPIFYFHWVISAFTTPAYDSDQ